MPEAQEWALSGGGVALGSLRYLPACLKFASAETDLPDVQSSLPRVLREEGACLLTALSSLASGFLDTAYLPFKQNQSHIATQLRECWGSNQLDVGSA